MNFYQRIQYLFWVSILVFTFAFVVPFFKFYKVILACYLKLKYGAKFKGFLGYIDNLYAKDGDNAKGIIENLAYIEAGTENPETIMEKISSDYAEKLFSGTREYPKKLFYSLCRSGGYCFWLDEEPGDFDKYIRMWEFETNKEYITQEDLKSFLSKKANTALPDKNTKGFELLVGNKGLQTKDGVEIPILIRFSHIFSDGFAIIRLVEEVLTEIPKKMDPLWFKNDTEENLGGNFITKCIMSIHELAMMPVRAVKKHSLNIKNPGSARVVDWIYESDVNDPLFQILKTAARQQKIRYNELATFALSQGIKEYFITKSEVPPHSILIGFPEKGDPINEHFVWENSYSIGHMRIPIEHPKGMTSRERYNFISKQIQDGYPTITKLIRSNFSMRILLSNLPYQLQYMMCKSSNVSLIFSALLMPNEGFRMAGYDWKWFTVFGPCTDSIPLTVYFTVYNKKLQISVMAAKEVFHSEKDTSKLLECMVNEIKGLQYL